MVEELVRGLGHSWGVMLGELMEMVWGVVSVAEMDEELSL